MIHKIKKLFKSGDAQPTTEFSAFFTSASAREKKKVFTEVIRKANQDQRDIIERYNKVKTKTT